MKKTILTMALIGVSFGLQAQVTEKIQTEVGLKANFVYKGGNVGIGTATPNQRLNIASALPPGYTSIMGLNESSNNGNNSMGIDWYFAGASGYPWGSTGRIEMARQNTSASFDMALHTASSGILSEKMRILANGNIGIGTNASGGILSKKFEVYTAGGSAFANNHISLGVGAAGAYGGANHLDFTYNDYGNIDQENLIGKIVASTHVITPTDVGGYLSFYTKATGGTYASTPLERMRINSSGNVGIGITKIPTGYKLAIAGKVISEEVKIQLKSSWPDYVFETTYNLPSLQQVEQYIKDKGHLQNIPSAKEVAKNGVLLGEMNAKLLQKIEELTLYTIAQEKKINSLEAQKSRIEKLEKENSILKSLAERLAKLEKKINN